MNRLSTAAVVLMLVLFPLSAKAAEPKGTITCIQEDASEGLAAWSLSDQSCLRVGIGLLSPGTAVEFNISADAPVDILLFSSTGVVVYQQEQNYRRADVWESDSVFESFSGDGSWRWSTPSDRGATRWYLVVDNYDHAQDQDQGALGGSTVGVSFGVSVVQEEPFTLYDDIVHLSPSSFATLAGPFQTDQGTVVKIAASSMKGESDVFLMSQNQYQLYSAGAAPARIDEGSMLLVGGARTVLFSVTEELDGADLYVVLDNKAGGGGVGTSSIATTVTVTLTPILDPRITDSGSLAVVDVGQTVTLDASTTPNRSGQITSEGYLWDLDGDGFSDAAGMTVQNTWNDPADLTIHLRVIGIDGRPATKFHEISIQDLSPPVAQIDGAENITRTFGESVSMTGTYSDNWQVVSVKWYLGDTLVLTDPSPQKQGTSSLNLEIGTLEISAGTHPVRMEVTDASGMMSNSTSNLTVYDATPPSVNDAIVELTRLSGETIRLEASAADPESETLAYSWDIDVNEDSDGDGVTNNDQDLSGPVYVVAYTEVGIYSAICTITNDNGLQTKIEYIVAIEASDTEPTLLDAIIPYLPFIGAGVVAILLALSLVLLISRRAKRKMAEIEEEMRTLQEEQARAPNEDEQKQMFARRSADEGYGGGYGFRRTAAPPVSNDPDIAALLGRSPDDVSSTSPRSRGDELLSMMFDDDPIDEKQGEPPHPRQEEQPTTPMPPKIPEITQLEDTTPVEPEPEAPPPAVEPEPEPEAPPPAVEPEPEPEPPSPLSEEPDNNTTEENPPQDHEAIELKSSCSSCSSSFKVKIPPGAPGVRVPCPACGSIEVVRRP